MTAVGQPPRPLPREAAQCRCRPLAPAERRLKGDEAEGIGAIGGSKQHNEFNSGIELVAHMQRKRTESRSATYTKCAEHPATNQIIIQQKIIHQRLQSGPLAGFAPADYYLGTSRQDTP